MKTLALASLLSFINGVSAAPAAAATTKVTWHGHAAFEIVTPRGKTLLIDPWLKNPKNPAKNPLGGRKADFILLTHGHSDHVGDAVELAKAAKSRLVANFELGTSLARLLGFPKDQMGLDTLGNTGGTLKLADDELTVQFTPAVHSSGIDAGEDKPLGYGGNPNGFLIRIKDGPTIYHSGDTAYFKDMEQLAEADVDLALLNIGGHFGMEPEAAATAARAINPRLVVPHHYGTFPVLTQSPAEFFKALDEDKLAHRELSPGETLFFDGKEPKK